MVRSLSAVFSALPFVALCQTPADAHLQQARDAYAISAWERAQAYADSAIALDGALPGAYKLRGDIRQRQGNMHGAMMDYMKAEKQDNTDARLYVSRSAVHITEGRLKDAIRDIDKALKLDPKDGDAWYNSACANYLGRNNEAAMRDLDRAVALKPSNADALLLRGVVKGEMFKEESGLDDIKAAMALKPDIAGGGMSAGILLFEMKRYDEAITQFTQVIESDTTDLATAHYYRADCYYAMDDKDKACIDWRRSGEHGDKDAQFIVRNYCNTDAAKIPKKPRKDKKSVIEF